MSDDLRYYFFDHEADEHPSIPPDEGWKQMQQLLDAELPVSAKGTARRYLFFITALLTGSIFLMTALPLQNYFERKKAVSSNPGNNKILQTSNTLMPDPQKSSVEEIKNAPGFIAKYLPGNSFINNAQQSPHAFSKTVTDLQSNNKETDNLVNEEAGINNTAAAIIASQVTDTSKNITAITKADKKEENLSSVNKKKKEAGNNFKSWQLNAGVAENISLSNTVQALQPYPFAEVKYQFAPRFFMAASISLFSPVGSNASGIKKTVYLNDTSADVSRYNEKLNYKKLSYADLSLTAGIKLTKQISVQSGLQFSRLLKTKTNTSLDPYDFDSNRVSVTDVGTIAPTPSAAPVYNNNIEARKLDIRYVAGINYDLKKFAIGLQYQAGLKPVLKGNNVTADKNKLLTLKVAYRFK